MTQLHVPDGPRDYIQTALSCGFAALELPLSRLLLLGLQGQVLHPVLRHLKFAFHFENVGLGLDRVGGKILTCAPNITCDASLALFEDLVSLSVLLLLRGEHEAMLSYIELSRQLLQLAVLVE